MPSVKRVIFSYLSHKNAQAMTKQEAQKIVDKMSPEKLEKIKKLFKPFLKLFKKSFTEKNAAFFDIIKKINKTTGIPIAELAAVGMILFGVASPSFADTAKEDTKIEKVEKRPVSEIRKELSKVFELPSALMNLVKMTPQIAINLKGIDGFIKTVNKNLDKSITPEVAQLLSQIPEGQWPEVLSNLVMEKINADAKVEEKFNKFIEHHKTTNDVMKREIASVVQQGKSNIQNLVKKGLAEKSLARKAYERGYLIS